MPQRYTVVMENQTCAHCGAAFVANSTRAMYCGDSCRYKAYHARQTPEARERRLAGARARASERRSRDPDYERGWHMRRYGLSLAEYEARLIAQEGVCAACGRGETALTPAGRPFRLAVDHDHATGAVRGLLCSKCNIALGHLGDDPSRIEALANYLKRAD